MKYGLFVGRRTIYETLEYSNKREEVAWEIQKSLSKEGITKYKERYEKALLKSTDIYKKLKIKEEPPIDFIKDEKREFEKLKLLNPTKKNITVNFISTFDRVGTTSLALNLASFLSKRELSSCYNQCKSSLDLKNIVSWEKLELEKDYFTNGKLHFYYNNYCTI